MPNVEIDETVLQQYQSVANFVQAGLSNPETRRTILEVQKKLNPKAHVPEIDGAKPVMDRMEALEKQLAEERDARAKDKEERETAERLNALKSKWTAGQQKARESGYSDEGLEKLEKFMEERGVADHEIAMAAFEKLNPRSEPITSNANPFANIFTPEVRQSDNMKSLFEGSPDQWLAQAVNTELGRRVL